jgi:hypothetical protein
MKCGEPRNEIQDISEGRTRSNSPWRKRDRVIITAVDRSSVVESRASPPGWTGETPVPPPYDSSRGHGTGVPVAFQ